MDLAFFANCYFASLSQTFEEIRSQLRQFTTGLRYMAKRSLRAKREMQDLFSLPLH